MAESRLALPMTAVYAVVVCLSFGLISEQLWLPFAFLAASTYLMVVLNNANALIRIYSRMVSCSFLVLALLSKQNFIDTDCSIVQLCFIAFHVLLFSAYQDKRAVGRVFYAFLMLGIASTVFPQMLFYVPLAWILMFTNVLAGSMRSLCASLLGLFVPYWFWGVYCLYSNDINTLIVHLSGLSEFGGLLDFTSVSLRDKVIVSFLSLLSLAGMIHFHRNNYKDRIRTRMLFEIFTVFNLATMCFALLQPVHLKFIISLLTVSTAPMTGHYISLTNTKWTNLSFLVISFIALLITVSNLWMPF